MNQPALKKSLFDEIYRSGDSDYMVSLARGLHVIQIFCDEGRGQLTIADITRISGLSRTVVSRCLYTLQELGFVGREGRKFSLLPKVLKLGYGYVSAAGLPTLAQPILDSLTNATNSDSAIVVLEGDDVLYVARSKPQTNRTVVTLTVNIGRRRPARDTASGLVLLANVTTPDLESRLDSIGDDQTSDEQSDRQLRDRIEQVRRDDFAVSTLSFAPSMRALAVPVRNVVGKVVAAMVTAVYDETSSDDELKRRYLPLLRKSAGSLSQRLVD